MLFPAPVTWGEAHYSALEYEGPLIKRQETPWSAIITPQTFSHSPRVVAASAQSTRAHFVSPLDPYDRATLSRFESTWHDVATYGYLRLALKAIRHAFDNDYMTALLLACAATEGIIGRIVKDRITTLNQSGSAKSLANRLLKACGASLLIEILPLLFYDASDISLDLQTQCLKSFQVRNKVMHHLENDRGQASVFLAETDFSNAYGGCIKYYMALQQSVHA